MRYLSPYRLASYLLALFCAGHTVGGVLSQKGLSPEAYAVLASMKAVQFDFHGSSSSWYEFWYGLGLSVSVFLLFSAIAAWQLDKVGPESWPAVSVIAWALVASHVANVVLAWAYFFAGPGIISTAATLLLAVGTVRKQQLVAKDRAR
ncbi:MAG: LIC_13387 family protein [Gemmatimonadaceae bacterium]